MGPYEEMKRKEGSEGKDKKKDGEGRLERKRRKGMQIGKGSYGKEGKDKNGTEDGKCAIGKKMGSTLVSERGAGGTCCMYSLGPTLVCSKPAG